MIRKTCLLVAVVLIPGCDVLFGPPGGGRGVETGSARLKRFSSEQELREFFVDQITARNARFAPAVGSVGVFEEGAGAAGSVGSDAAAPVASEGDAGTPPANAETQGDDDFSGTTLQEAGVDEADVVKTDGTRVYLIDGGTLRIVRVTPPDQLALLSQVSLEGTGRDIFLHDDKVITLTSTGGSFFIAGGGGLAIKRVRTASQVTPGLIAVPEPGFGGDFTFERPRTIVTVVDVSAPETPNVLSKTTFDGTAAASRLIEGVLHLVLSNFQNFFFDVLPALGRPELNLASVDADTLLPKFDRVDGDGTTSSGSIVTFKELFRPTDPDGFGVVTVVSLDIDADAAFTGVGVVAEPGLVYSSLDALYLTDTAFNFADEVRETTDIYKFAYQNRGAVAAATGSVPGRVLNQFSMGEYQGNLRVATTLGPTFSRDGRRTEPVNNVYVLQEVDGELNIMGRIENIAPGETIQSARFLGARGYLVTFEQIDPFFTLDLSDPADPVVVGRLKVPGFSTLILPMDANHLLTVGQFVPEEGPVFPQGVQVSIFDVTDFAKPQRTANIILGEGSGAFSEALFNHKALTYFPQRGLVALPVTIQESGGFVDVVFSEESAPAGDGTTASTETGSAGDPVTSPDEPVVQIEPVAPPGFEGLVVFRATPEAGLSELGRLSTRVEGTGFFHTSFTRGVFVADNVFAVTNQAVRGAPVDDLSSVAFELLLPPVEP